jgi:hypothetical protein
VRHSPKRFFGRMALFVLGALLLVSRNEAQEPSKAPTAIKLPDGTVVLYTQNPNEVAPKIDGVVLSAKQYQQLLEQAEQLKKSRETNKLISPSVCRIRGNVDTRSGKPIAKLSIEYAFRTRTPRTSVLLGGQRAAPTSATASDGKLPLLEWSTDGLSVIVETPGDHKMTLELEAAVIPRSGQNELGFEIGLPRSAITSLLFDAPSPEVRKFTIGTRTPDGANPRPSELARVTEDAARFAVKPDATGVALGPIEWLEVAWVAPTMTTSKPVEATLAAEADVAVQVDDTQIETNIKLKLRGPAREWQTNLPRNATLTATRASTERPDFGFPIMPTITRPTDAAPTLWKIQTPDASEWLITAIVRQPRPDAKDPKFSGRSAAIGYDPCLGSAFDFAVQLQTFRRDSPTEIVERQRGPHRDFQIHRGEFQTAEPGIGSPPGPRLHGGPTVPQTHADPSRLATENGTAREPLAEHRRADCLHVTRRLERSDRSAR